MNIFPEYYLIEVERFDDLVHTPLDEWIYFFKHSEIKPEFSAPGMQEAREKLDYLKMDESDKKAYRRYSESLASERDVISTAKMDGWEDGILEGERRGVRKTARNLLRKGVSPEMVVDATGLSMDEVEKLKARDDFERSGVTCLVVSHRKAALRRANQIIVLKDGHIVDSGLCVPLLPHRLTVQITASGCHRSQATGTPPA